MSSAESTFVYVGNRRHGPSSWQKAPAGIYGIGVFAYDVERGRLSYLKTIAEELSVGAFTFDPNRNVLYALDETLTLPGYHLGGGGQVYAFQVNRQTGDLTELSRQPSFGTLPCYATLDTRGDFLVVVHHTGNTPITRTETQPDGSYRIVLDYDEAGIVLFPLNEDGSPAPPCDILRLKGHGALPGQTHPHLHSVARAPSQDLFVATDKGSDRIHVFSLDRAAGKLIHHTDRTIVTPPGSSPRYCVFHPRLPVFYVNFESTPLVHTYRYDPDGAMTQVDTVSPLSDDIAATAETMQSDLLLHPNGKYLYDLVRRAEVAGVFAIDEITGRLTRIETKALAVDNARGAAISPDGRHFLVAAVIGKEVRVWPIAADGRIEGEGEGYPQPSPGFVVFA